MTAVPKNIVKRKQWVARFGADFERQINYQKTNYVCRIHFVQGSQKRRFKNAVPLKTRTELTTSEQGSDIGDDSDLESDSSVESRVLQDNIKDEDYCPSSDSEQSDTDTMSDSDIENNDHSYDYFVVEKSNLLDLILWCRDCKTDSVSYLVTGKKGMAVSFQLECNLCSKAWTWSTSSKNDSHDSCKINKDFSTASACTGLPFSKLAALFAMLEIPCLTIRGYNSITSRKVSPVVDRVYKETQAKIIQDLALSKNPIDLAGDAMFDSRGYSALYCRYALLEVRTGIVLETEWMHKNRGESSKAMEPKTLHISLNRLQNELLASGGTVSIRSITTDRDPSVAKLLSTEFPRVDTFFDCWHFLRNIEKSLWQKTEQKQMSPVRPWIRPMINHLYYAIKKSNGDGILARDVIISFFLHCQNIHKNFKVAADTSYFEVLIRDIDNPAGTLLDGTTCSPFGFVGYGCNTYLTGGVAAGANLVNVFSNSQLNSHGEARISNLNLIVKDTQASAVTEFTGFNISFKLTTSDGFVIDEYNFRVDTTENQGIYSYTSLRPGTLPTTISIAWATNIAPPSITSTTEFTGSTPTAGPTTTAPKLPSDCDEVESKTSGVQVIYPDGSTPVSVYCEQKTSGAYTVIQSRGTTGTNTSFDILYANYSDWFGQSGIGNNFWLGLDNMNSLSSNGKSYSLQIDLCCGTQLIAKQIYHSFKVDTKANQYTLTASADVPGVGLDYSSSGKDIGAPFSTSLTYSLPKGKAECDQFEYYDDDDNQSAAYGGWWFGSCGNNLNGFLYSSNNGDCTVTKFGSTKMLGVNMRTTSGQGVGGYDVDLVSYDRVRMALFTFDSLDVDRTDDSFCK